MFIHCVSSPGFIIFEPATINDSNYRHYSHQQIQSSTATGTRGLRGGSVVLPVAKEREAVFARVTGQNQPMGENSASEIQWNGRIVEHPVKVGTSFGVYYLKNGNINFAMFIL